MCTSPSAPPPAAKLPEAPVTPDTSQSASNKNKRRRAGAGFNSTILTGARGVSTAAPTGKVLLGN